MLSCVKIIFEFCLKREKGPWNKMAAEECVLQKKGSKMKIYLQWEVAWFFIRVEIFASPYESSKFLSVIFNCSECYVNKIWL